MHSPSKTPGGNVPPSKKVKLKQGPKIDFIHLCIDNIKYLVYISFRMSRDWQDLTRMTRGEPFIVERIKMEGSGIAVEGSFELPPLARLTVEDQVFVTAFVRCHGSIKEMEQLFGISYPTVKNRLVSVASKLEFVEINPPASRVETLARLEKGEISAAEALRILGGEK
jgi:hypothetical protein